MKPTQTSKVKRRPKRRDDYRYRTGLRHADYRKMLRADWYLACPPEGRALWRSLFKQGLGSPTAKARAVIKARRAIAAIACGSPLWRPVRSHLSG